MLPFLARLDANLAGLGTAPALLFPDSPLPRLTYGQLRGCIARIGARIAAEGVAAGGLVCIELTNGLLHGAALLACMKLGLPSVSAKGLPGVVAAHCVLRLVDSAAGAEDGPPCLAIGPGLLRDDPATAEPAWATPGPDDICRVTTTSGSTGRPKPVLLTYAMVQGRLDSLAAAFGDAFAAEPGLLCAMPYGTSLGYAFFLERVVRGGLFCGESLDFARLARTIAAEGIGALVTTPHTLGEYAAYMAQNRGAALPRTKLVLTAGARLAPALAAELGRLFADELVCFYGTTECGVVATQRCAGDAPWPLRVVANRRIDIVDEAGALLPAGATGRVRIRAAEGPVPLLPDFGVAEAPPWFEPGDLGQLDADGAFSIAGRADNVLNAGGSKLLAEDLEEIIARAPGILECGIAALPDAMGVARIACGFVRTPKWQQQAFLDYCERNIPRDFLPSKFVILPRGVPRTPTRKVDRPALAALLAKS